MVAAATGANRIRIGLGLYMDEKTLSAVQKKLAHIQTGAARMGERIKTFGTLTQRAGENLTRRISMPLLIGAGIVAKVAGDFEGAVNVLAAKSGAAAEELAQLRDRAKELGATTQFTAGQAADGMTEFAKAGFSATQILDAIGPALDFAVVAQMNLAEVTGLTANVLSQFGLQAKDAGLVADLLSKAADSSTTEVRELGEAMVYAGTSANAVGVDLRETSAILAALANVGVKGGMAGTALANAFIKIAAPTETAKKTIKELGINLGDFVDKTGKMKRPFGEFLMAMNKSGATMEQVMEIFDIRAGRAMVGLINDTDKLAAAMESLADVEGNAAKQAAVMMQGFNGALKEMKSALQGLAIAIGDTGLLQWVTDGIKFVARMARNVSGLNPRLLRTATAVAAVAATAGPLLITIGLITKALGAMVAMIGTTAAAAFLPFTIGLVLGLSVFLLINDLYAFLDGRPSVIGYLLADPDSMLRRFHDWVVLVGDFLFTTAKGSIFDLVYQQIKDIIDLVTFGFGGKSKKGANLSGTMPSHLRASIGLTDSEDPNIGFPTSFVPGAFASDMIEAIKESEKVPQPVRLRPESVGPSRELVGPTRQIISPTINVTLTKPGSTADDVVNVLRRETAKIFSDVATQNQPAMSQ